MSDLGDQLAKAVTGADAMRHLHALQRIADRHDGNRATGTGGFAASVVYVTNVLTAAGYQVTAQDVPCTRFVVTAERSQVTRSGWCPRTLLMDDSPQLCDVVAPLVVISGTDDPGDHAGQDLSGAVVLLARALGGYDRQVAAASEAGAVAVLLYISNPCPGNIYRLHWYQADPPPIPLASISQDDAKRLAAYAADGPIELRLDWHGGRVSEITSNILADASRGGPASVVAGAHLDSVPEAPGINDNGSGVAAVLQTAIELAPLQEKASSKVRFAFWGAEELVNVGSNYYVSQLTSAERAETLLYLNAEMIGSPNYVQYVMHGPGTVTAPFDTYFQQHQVSYEYLDAGEVGSDHIPFRDAGIPVGGLHCGTIGIKTAADQERYGGTDGQLYDPGYHQIGDTVSNISRAALDWNARAMAYAVGRAAEDASDLV